MHHYARDLAFGEDGHHSAAAPQAVAATRNAVLGPLRLLGATRITRISAPPGQTPAGSRSSTSASPCPPATGVTPPPDTNNTSKRRPGEPAKTAAP